MDSILNAARKFNERHERLKKHVHTAWRVPLPKWGRVVMGCIYFSIPVVGGWNVMQWAIGRAHDSIGEKGEKLRIKDVQGIGDQTVFNGETKRIGAGGVGMGVKLAVSDEHDQERSKKMLAKMLRKAKKQKLKREAERKEEQSLSAEVTEG
mmetsp:Transcript_9949/g.12535  ORF Transcript_9949/g.12535 Transcript_9949/m.12535 type:complete len:151 (+) Transcript_9949:40-492(+)|eukprot:CAMPEP_0203663546 /NCGR_PEP_ID=MMETSP0090-20130426/1133_1 /ASSEMBLY_ACC=CAM_ASM_001088 /TAXON_ID=426623 /ORGANISM="Chaetoceros affinis, Strain CCMP159" /LENGTH=150 /DNA_ID=CAMNT_0050526499 /DNA_START=39 /DNA_END=491 /DNA_ORIENTATION=-